MKEMRRKDREIGTEEAREILTQGEYGILSTVDAAGNPYGIPLSYAYRGDFIYFHCAVAGHKLENLEQNPRVSFCVVGKTKVLPAQFATEYESAVAFGVATEIEGSERYKALLWLLEKYSRDFVEEGKRYLEKQDKATKCFKIEIDRISGKARR